jgi:peptide/nickel transport system permease protein
MIHYALRRIPSAILVLLAASVVVFGLIHLAKGDPGALAAGPDASQAEIAAKRHQLGLDSSLTSQYLHWLHGLLTGNLGHAYISGASIGELVRNGLGNTVELTIAAVVLALVFGGAAGLGLGVGRRKPVNAVLSGLTTLAFAVPTYVSGVLLVLVFAVTMPILPAGGHESLLSDPSIGVQYLIMPAVCLSLPAAATIARFLATSMRQVLDEEFLNTGIAKGLKPRRLLFRHALPNALPPVLTILGIQIGQMLGGAIVVEAIFAWPGVGQLLRDSVLDHEYLIVQDLLLFAVAVFIVVQMITDLVHACIDPRIRTEY